MNDVNSNPSPEEAVLQSLFGPKVTSWPYSEETLQRALQLRTQQEITKQEYYKTEYMNRCLELLRMAAMAKVPGDMIPTIFSAAGPARPQTTSAPASTIPVPTPTHSRTPSSASFSGPAFQDGVPILKQPSQPMRHRPTHSRSRSESPVRVSNFAPGFRFGSNPQSPVQQHRNPQQLPSPIRSPTGVTSLPPRHQLSPTRIGAQAISSLAQKPAGSRDVSDLKHGADHQRTFSLPNNVSIPESKPLSFHPGTPVKKRRLDALDSVKIDLTVLETPSKQKEEPIELKSPPPPTPCQA